MPHAAGPEAAVPEHQSKIASHAYTRQRTVTAPTRTPQAKGSPTIAAACQTSPFHTADGVDHIPDLQCDLVVQGLVS